VDFFVKAVSKAQSKNIKTFSFLIEGHILKKNCYLLHCLASAATWEDILKRYSDIQFTL
jgi:hypothetical protein